MHTDLASRLADMTSTLEIIHERRNNPAGCMFERLASLINRHQATLSDDMELGALVVGGGSYTFHLRGLSFSNPDILIFTGVDSSGNTVELLQHYSQMGVVLVSLPKLEERPYRIGFPTTPGL